MKVESSHSTSNTYKWLITILSGLFMFLVLYVYRAYHIDQVPAFTGHNMLFRAMIHSLIISSVFYIIEFHLGPRLHLNEKVKLLVTALMATFIGLHLTFLAFNYFYHWTEMHWISYSQFFYEYPLILIFPVILSFLMDKLLSRSKRESNSLISITSENQKEHFQIKPENLLFIKSADNYIEIFYSSRQQVNKHLLRKTLKDIEEENRTSDFLVRCHRSYLVNPGNVDHISKSNGKIELNISGITIPVSKKYAENLTEKHPRLSAPHLNISSQSA